MHPRRELLAGGAILFMTFTATLLNSVVPSADPPVRPTPPRSLPDSPSATPPAGFGVEIAVSDLENVQHLPAVAYNWRHHEYLVLWHNEWGDGRRDIYAQRVSVAGQPLSGFTVTGGSHDRAQPAAAYDPDNDRFLVVWVYDVNGDGSNWDVYGRLIPWNGPDTNLTEFPICKWGGNQWDPVVAYNAHPGWHEFFVFWTDTPAGGPAYISGRRIYASGAGFPSSGSDAIIAHAVDNRLNPRVTHNLVRNEYLMVYDNGEDVFASRLAASGAQLGGGEVHVADWPETEARPDVASCTTTDQYLVVWQSWDSTSAYDIYARLVGGDGALDGGRLHVYGTTANDKEPVVACGPGVRRFLVAWQEQYSGVTGPYGVSARFVEIDGSMDEPIALISPYSGAERTDPAIASGPPSHLVVWEHDQLGSGFQDIHGRLYMPFNLFLPNFEK
jgi:hypothetical protein